MFRVIDLAALSLAAMANGCAGNAASVEGGKILSIDVGDRPRAIAVADLDGDNRADIAVANADGDSVTILLRSAEADTFVRTDYPAGNEPSDVELGDFDRDGDLDAAFANHETSMVTVLLNDGRGAFAPAPSSPYDTQARPHLHGLAVGDFDGDGWLDIAADSSDSDLVVVLRGGPSGFRRGQPFDAGLFPYYRIASLLAPGGTDILVPSPRANRVSRIAPRRSASSAPIVVGDATGAMMVIAADLDGAGEDDVVATIDGGVAMWRAEGGSYRPLEGTPAPFDTPTEIASGDIDGDGRDEVAVGLWEDDRVHVIGSDGKVRGSIEACYRPAALAVADLDDDGRAEIVAGCWNEAKIMILRPKSLD